MRWEEPPLYTIYTYPVVLARPAAVAIGERRRGSPRVRDLEPAHVVLHPGLVALKLHDVRVGRFAQHPRNLLQLVDAVVPPKHDCVAGGLHRDVGHPGGLRKPVIQRDDEPPGDLILVKRMHLERARRVPGAVDLGNGLSVDAGLHEQPLPDPKGAALGIKVLGEARSSR